MAATVIGHMEPEAAAAPAAIRVAAAAVVLEVEAYLEYQVPQVTLVQAVAEVVAEVQIPQVILAAEAAWVL